MTSRFTHYETLEQMLSGDTPPTLELLNELLCAPLASMAGVVVQGKASPIFAPHESWGRPMTLETGEQLHLRTYPPGLLGMLAADKRPPLAIVAARRRGGASQMVDTAFALLWDDAVASERLRRLGEGFAPSSRSAGVRALHVLLPSLFRHHEPSVLLKAENDRWYDHDHEHFRRVRSHSVSVRRRDGQETAYYPGAGGSKWVVAGDFLEVDVELPDTKAVVTVDESMYKHGLLRRSNEVAQGARRNGYTAAQFDAAAAHGMMVCDMLTCEGIVAMLGTPVLDGAWPDVLHMPGGFPLTIAFAIRIACYPQRYGLPPASTADRWANDQIVSLFESNWAALPPETVGAAKGLYAIDLVIARVEHAVEQARKVLRSSKGPSKDAEAMPRNHLAFWQRAGQRCAVELFGASCVDYEWGRGVLGPCHKLEDPASEARRRVLRRTLEPEDIKSNDAALPFGHVDAHLKKMTLLHVINSVEHWLRSGQYGRVDVSRERRQATPPAAAPAADAAADAAAADAAAADAVAATPAMTAGELRVRMHDAVAKHVADRLRHDPAVSLRGAGALQRRMAQHLERFLQHAPDDAPVHAIPTEEDQRVAVAPCAGGGGRERGRGRGGGGARGGPRR